MPIAGSLEATFEASPVGGWLIDKENFQRRLHPQMAHDYAMNIYPIDSYAFGVLDVQLSEVEKSSKAKLEALEKEYLLNGLVTSVQLVLVLHNRGHPHVLALQRDADLFTL